MLWWTRNFAVLIPLPLQASVHVVFLIPHRGSVRCGSALLHGQSLKLLNLTLQIRWDAGTVQTFKMEVPFQGYDLRNVAHTVIACLIPE
jgi:hypothetical protein